jgi:hypothetical protein
MSRNARQKLPAARAPKPKRRRVSDTTTSSSSLDLSDDGGYSAVEEISESEDDDEEHVVAAEEEHIITHEAHRGQPRSLPPQQDVEDDADEDDDDDEEDDEDENTGVPEHAVVDDEDEEDDDGDEVASWDGILSDGEGAAPAGSYMLDPNVANVERHVRFTGVPDSDSDSTTSETSEDIGGFFPDIFVEQASLDPAFRREIEYDPDESSASGDSFWDFGSQDRLDVDSDDELTPQGLNDGSPTPTPTVSQPPTEASTPVASGVVQELDGYESESYLSHVVLPSLLIHPLQPTVTQPKRMSPNRRSDESWPGASSCWMSRLAPILSAPTANLANRVWDGITSTARIGNRLPSSIRFLAR